MAEITVSINGETQRLNAPLSLADLLLQLDLSGGRVAIERNRRIVKRQDYAETAVSDGDQIEIIHFVGGGATL